jgi:thymidine kinase
MIRFTGKGVSATCDICESRKVVHPARDVQALTNEARRRGWLVELGEREEWRHVCGDCSELEEKEQFK